ncbi:NUAK family SNF1-like kinase 1 [Halotydeus destructor]|nr:NUAK family SNF1-like kinase 1 [Halotydeus destructor]
MVVSERSKDRPSAAKLDMSIGNLGGAIPITTSASGSGKQHRLKQRFQVIKKLGQGTYGKVQLAVNKETGQEVAIKTIKKSKIESEQDLVRIRREIQIMSSIQHPHIIHIFEVFENKEKIVLVMQYASGGELYEYVSERKVLNDNEARRLFRQIATAVYYCHKNKVCHRDLKLENILLDEKGNAKIGDFGLSNVFDEKHFLQTFCGSPLYASPEIVKGTPYYGPEVDCWSMGVLLYTLVYGAMPFDGSNFKRLVKQISEANYYEPKQKSEASSLIRKLLAVNPSRRATIVDICANDWVNHGFDNTLLQVAEDMSNLTPVRLDLLLALAPMSPTDAPAVDPFKAAVKPKTKTKTRAAPKRQEEVSDDSLAIDASTTDASVTTEVPSILHEESDHDLIDEATQSIEFMPSAIAAALEEESRDQTGKRGASGSFDRPRPVSRNTTVVDKKKRSKMSDSAETIKGPDYDTQIEQSPSLQDEFATNEQVVNTNPLAEYAKEMPSQVPTIEQSAKQEAAYAGEHVREEEKKKEPAVPPALSDINSQEAKKVETSKHLDDKSAPVKRVPDHRRDTAVPERENAPPPGSPPISQPSKLPPTPPASSLPTPAPSAPPSRKPSVVSSEYPTPSVVSTPSRTASEVDPNDVSKLKRRHQSLERRLSSASSGRRVGRLSIPNFMEIQERAQPVRKTIPSYGSITDMKKKLLERKDSVCSESDKEHVFPTIPVSDAKQDVERRSSMIDTVNLRKGPSGIRLASEQNADETRIRRKIHHRSQSVGEEMLSPRRVLDSVQEPNGGHIEEENSQSPDARPEEKVPETKNMAKEVLKRQLNKSIMSDKRQASTESQDSAQLGYTVETPDAASRRAPFAKEGSANSTSQEIVEPSKPAPITRSYKKVTFTKDGACVTETGKILTTETPDGKVTRVEQKSKVTHYPTADGQAVSTETTLEESTTSFGGEIFDNLTPLPIAPLRMLSPPPISGTDGGVRKSDSVSSSGSTDIFDDVFDTWTCDTMFSNSMMGGRMKSLFQNPFGRRKGTRSKRSDSGDRREGIPGLRTSGGPTTPQTDHASDSEPEMQDLMTGASGGLFKFMRENSRTQKPLFSRFPDDPFSGQDPFARMNRMTSMFGSKDEPGEGDASASCNATPRGSVSSANVMRPASGQRRYGRTVSNQSTLLEPETGDSEDPVASRRRVEAWLRTNPEEDEEGNDDMTSLPTQAPTSIYATMRQPMRPMSRYARTMSGHFDDPFEDLFSPSSPLSAFPRPMAGFMPMRPLIQTRSVITPSGPSQSRIIYQSGGSVPTNEPEPSAPSPSTGSESAWDAPVSMPDSSPLLTQLRNQGGYRNAISVQTGRNPSSPTKSIPGSMPGSPGGGTTSGQPGSPGAETVQERIHRKSFYRRIQEQC